MNDVSYRQLSNMRLTFVSGTLERNAERNVLSYTVAFRMSLDFLNFVVMTEQFIRGYLNNPLNAIRPELRGLAYHDSYNYFSGAAGKIHTSEALFKVFTNPGDYFDDWVTAELQNRYNKPSFQHIGDDLQITARRDYRWTDEREIDIKDLPTIPFDWMLNVMEGHEKNDSSKAPAAVVLLGYAAPEMVEVAGVPMRKGTRYMIGSELQIGAISEAQILTA